MTQTSNKILPTNTFFVQPRPVPLFDYYKKLKPKNGNTEISNIKVIKDQTEDRKRFNLVIVFSRYGTL